MDFNKLINESLAGYILPSYGLDYGRKSGDWTKSPGRAKRKRKQKIQKVSRKNNRRG